MLGGSGRASGGMTGRGGPLGRTRGPVDLRRPVWRHGDDRWYILRQFEDIKSCNVHSWREGHYNKRFTLLISNFVYFEQCQTKRVHSFFCCFFSVTMH